MTGKKSILIPDFRNTIFTIHGLRGRGKTIAAIQADTPDNILFLDYEGKGESIARQMPGVDYHHVPLEAAKLGASAVSIYRRTEQIINELKPNDRTVVIIDNVSVLELGMMAEVQMNVNKYAQEYALNVANVTNGRFGGTRSVVNRMIQPKIVFPLQSKGVRLLIVTSMCTPRWTQAGPIPNKYGVKGQNAWLDLSSGTFILVPGDYPPIPAAIVVKEQLPKIEFKDGAWNIKRCLPQRMPMFTFEAIRNYIEHPADLSAPKAGETISDTDYKMYSEELTSEQIGLVREMLAYKQQADHEEEEDQASLNEIASAMRRETVRELLGSGKTPAQIAKDLGLSVSDIVQFLPGE